MESRAAKLALARKKLRDHQVKKTNNNQKDDLNLKSCLNQKVDNLPLNNEADCNDFSNLHQVHDILTTEALKETEVTEELKPSDTEQNCTTHNDINVTEILISSKRNMELQILDLQMKLSQLESNHASNLNDYKLCTQKVINLESELQNISNKYENATKEILIKDKTLNELNNSKLILAEENGNLLEQLEFTKTVLSAKEAENDSLHGQLYNLQNQFDVIQLQLQQLTNGSSADEPTRKHLSSEKNQPLLQKISNLEQQLSLLQKERDQINLHYEHYVTELNDQLKSVVKKNEILTTEVQNLSQREINLIEQISDMEIRIQNYNLTEKRELEFQKSPENNDYKKLESDFKKIQEDLDALRIRHKQLQQLYEESTNKIKELSDLKETDTNHDICLSKLNADMTSDKIAAQRATEQNKKLKQDLQGLEDAFVKMSKDKLELTEKLTAEKYLNRELTIKLAEIGEKSKDMENKLKAKDEEMIRLQSSYRNIEKECEELRQLEQERNRIYDQNIDIPEENVDNDINLLDKNAISLHTPLESNEDKSSRLHKEDAMSKLQERFLKIMEEVADLSDEKHRLEHIILQLQNETDTICEYVALYQQQRSLLKRRDDERSAQLKIFQEECEKLNSQLQELSLILIRFSEDPELTMYFENVSNRNAIHKVMTLLSDLKNNSLVDPKKKHMEFNNFYPCNCCSGKLIEV